MLNDNIKRAIKTVNSVKDFDNLFIYFSNERCESSFKKDEAIRGIKSG